MLRIAIAALVVAAPVLAQSAPADLSGTWVMDAAKSDQVPTTPAKMSYVVRQKGTSFIVDRDITDASGQNTSTLTYGIDGKSWKNQFKSSVGPVDLSSVLAWEGSTLVIKTTLTVQGQEVHQTDRWTPSPDATTLTILRTIEVGGQEMKSKLILNRAA
jgi:hypothetical protein